MRKYLPNVLLTAALALSLPGVAEARRPTPVPSMVPERGAPVALALLANQEAVMAAKGETLLKEMARSLYISADRGAAETGVDLYFLRVESGHVVHLTNTVVNGEELDQMRAPFPEEAELPGETFLLGDWMVPVNIYLGEERLEPRISGPEPRDKRDEQMFAAAERFSNGGNGFLVAVYPVADPNSLAGGGFFVPQN